MKTLIVIVSLLLVGGCINTDLERWTQSGEDTTHKKAIYACKQDVDQRLMGATALGGALFPLIALSKAKKHMNACMEARGFKELE